MSESVIVEQGWKLPAVDQDLLLAIAYTVLAAAIMYLPIVSETPLRFALGLGLAIFVPGYALTAALFPGKVDIDGIERIALSFGLSIAVIPLVGLALNFTPWGIRLGPILTALAILTIACAVAAYKRRHELKPEVRYSVDFRELIGYARAGLALKGASRLDKVLSLAILLLIGATLAIFAYAVAFPAEGESFTGFYLLGQDGIAHDYPTVFQLGESKPVIVCVENHEHRPVTYNLVVALNNSSATSQIFTGEITVGDNETVEQKVDLKPDLTGSAVDMQFFLYADGKTDQPYRDLRLWVDVVPPR